MAMGIRETIKKHSAMTVAATLVVAAGALAYSLRDSGFGGPASASTKAFYTTDDGQSTFAADMSNLPPFERDGKPAVRVWMFSCDGGKTSFAGYLERYTPAAHKRLTAALAEQKAKQATPSLPIGPADSEVKKPGAGNAWVSRANVVEAAKVTHVTCPPGSGGELEIVLP